MANGSARVVPLLLGLVVFSGCCSMPGQPRKTGKGTATIVVGPTASELSIGELTLSYRDGDVASWVAKDRDKMLFIEFTDEPFRNMQKLENGRFRVQCNGRHCYSDEIRGRESYGRHKYWQRLDDEKGKPDEVDGMIIIVP